jgi:hypothetical protein
MTTNGVRGTVRCGDDYILHTKEGIKDGGMKHNLGIGLGKLGHGLSIPKVGLNLWSPYIKW